MNESAPVGLYSASAFRALRHRNYLLFFVGQAISLVGVWMQQIALRWLVYRLTGSAAMLGVINLAAGLSVVPLALWGGSLADRFPRRPILLITQSVMMLQAFVLAALTWADVIQIWHVLVLALVQGAASAMDLPARQAFVVEVVETKEDLASAIGLNSIITHVARTVGPAIAGVAIVTIGEGGAFLGNGLAFSAVLVSLLSMRLSASVHQPRQAGLRSHLWQAVQYVRKQQFIAVLISFVAVSAFLSMPYVTLLPVFAQDVLSKSAQPLLGAICAGPGAWFDCRSPDALTYGLLMAADGLGSVMGALFVASLPARARRGWWLTWGNLAIPLLLVCMALSRSFALTLILLVGIGFCIVIQNVLAATLIQIAVDDELRGRVMGFYSLAFQGMMVAGGVQAGLMGDMVGVSVAVGFGAVVCLAYGLFVWWRFPAVRQMT